MLRDRIDLTNVSLVAVTSDRPAETVRVMKHCMRQAEFKNALLFTNRDVEAPPQITLVPIDDMRSINEYCHFVMRRLPAYSDLFARHILIVHWDGYIVKPDMWTPEFLEYDYIGARWGEGDVGNGGFCLRSSKLMRTLLKLKAELLQTQPEDVAICRTYRRLLEDNGIRYASSDIADRFSAEDRPYEGSFGFHGRRIKEITDPAVFRCSVDIQDMFNSAMLLNSDLREHVPTLYRLAGECRHITEFCHRNLESTAAFLYSGIERLCSYNVDGSQLSADMAEALGALPQDFNFQCADSREIEIEPTDMLFIDSRHIYSHMKQELAQHAHRVKHYIVLHDTTTFANRGSEGNEGGIM